MKKPTEKHFEFARYYIEGMTAKDAAIEAGFSAQTADKMAYKWIGLNRSESFYPALFDYVQDARNTATEETERKHQVTIDGLVSQLLILNSISVTDILAIDSDGMSIKDPEEWPEDAHKAIQEISPIKGGGFKLKLYSKLVIIEKLMRHLGAYERDNRQRISEPQSTVDYSKLTGPELRQLLELERKANGEEAIS